MNVAKIEDFVEAKVRRKLHKVAANRQAEVDYRRDVRSWAQIADDAAFRYKAYEQRKQWVLDVVAQGLATHDEALELAKVKFKIP